MFKRYMFDIILTLIILVSIVAIFIYWAIGIKSSRGTTARIYRDGNEIMIIDLSENKTYEFYGTISKMKVEVKNGYIEVIYSGCENQKCVNQYAICNIGSSITCLPNKVEIRIEE